MNEIIGNKLLDKVTHYLEKHAIDVTLLKTRKKLIIYIIVVLIIYIVILIGSIKIGLKLNDILTLTGSILIFIVWSIWRMSKSKK